MAEKMSSKERFINALEGKEVDRIPFGYLWFGAGQAVLERMGKSMKDVYSSAEDMALAQILAREMYGHDNVMSPWGCLLVEAEALGTKVDIKANEYPVVEEFALKSSREYDKIDPEVLRCSGRIKSVIRSIEILKDKIGDEAFICGSALSPMMLAFQLLEANSLFIDMLKAPDDLHALLEKTMESSILFVDLMLEAGADGILIENGDSTADLFSPQMIEDFLLPYTGKLYDHVKGTGGYIISHNCAIHAYHDLELKLKPNAVNFAFGDVRLLGEKHGVECGKLHHHISKGCGQRYCFKEFKALSDTGICLMGNIVPEAPLNCTEAEIRKEVQSCLEAAPERGFILSTGCEIPLQTPFEKMEMLRKAVTENRIMIKKRNS